MSEAMKMGRGFWVTVEGCDSCGVISSDGCPFTNLDSYPKWVDEHDEEDFHPDCPLEREQPKLDIDIDGYAGEATRLIYTVWPKDAAWSGPKVKDLMVNFLTHLRPIPSIGIDEAVEEIQQEAAGYNPDLDRNHFNAFLRRTLTRYRPDTVAVLEKLEKEVAVVFSELECTCIDAYKGRNLVDPGCVACDVESLVEEVKNLIAKAKGER